MEDRTKIIAPLSLLAFSCFIFLASILETYINGKFSDYISAAADVAMAFAAWLALSTWKKQIDYPQKIKIAEEVNKAAQTLVWAIADARSDLDLVALSFSSKQWINEDSYMSEKFNKTRESYMRLSSLTFTANAWLGPEVLKEVNNLLDRWEDVQFAHSRIPTTKRRLTWAHNSDPNEQEKLQSELVNYQEITRGAFSKFSIKIDYNLSKLQSAIHRSIESYK